MLLLIILLLLGIYAFFQWRKAQNLPNGPIPFLFLGNVPQLIYYSRKAGGLVDGMAMIAKIYGDAHTLWFGPLATINLCSIEASKELMVNQGSTQTGRWTLFFTRVASYDENGNQRGVVASEGDYWVDHRRFILHTLRDFGMGSSRQEQLIYHEIDYHFSELEKSFIDGKGKVAVHDFTDLLISSIINHFIYGYGFDETNKTQFFTIRDRLEEFVNNISPIDLFIADWWRFVPILKKKYYRIYHTIEPMRVYARENIAKRKAALAVDKNSSPSGEPEDFVHAYLLEQKKRMDENNGDPGHFDDDGLIGDLVDVWGAGQETTSTTLQWAIYELMKKPAILEKCREEIEEVTAGTRGLSMKDRPRTPYLNAVLTELQRYASIIALNLWRRTTGYFEFVSSRISILLAPCQIGGCNVPVGTLTTAQIAVIMKNQAVFEDPDKFNPDRYLGENGRLLEQNTIPFGLGKRACLGESLARGELYLILANLVSRYRISPDPMEGDLGMTSPYSPLRKTNKFHAIFEKRSL